MKKLIAGLLALVAVVVAILIGSAASAGATENPGADNKKVAFCHYAGSNEHGGSGNYVSLETSVMAFYNAGHIDHVNDIWGAFSYTTVGGDVVNVPAQGDTSLLAFENCERPKVDTPVTKPDVTFSDPCGTENDTFAVAGGEGYTVGATQTDGVIQSITVTLAEGFVWNDETRDAVRFERPIFTNVDCGLPNTGTPQMAMTAGYTAVGGIIVLLVMGTTQLARQRQRERN